MAGHFRVIKIMSLEDVENRNAVSVFPMRLWGKNQNIRASMIQFIIRRDKIKAVNSLDFVHFIPWWTR